jgi:hypothetical protein
MMEGHRIWLPTYLIVLAMSGSAAANTFEMPWSTQTFGPDGPWHAVAVKVGTPPQSFSLLPGGSFSSYFFTPNICTNASLGSTCYAEAAGLYNAGASSSAKFKNISFEDGIDFTNGALAIHSDNGTAPLGGDTWMITGEDNIPNVDMALVDMAWGTLPDGSTYPLTIGNMALGAPGTNIRAFTGSNDTLSMLAGYLNTEVETTHRLSSSSWGMHIGSTYPNIPPSLWFGSYDQNRVIGPISSEEGAPQSSGSIDLLDISLTVNEGGSPWPFNSLAGLLASGNTTIGDELPVAINPQAPYLHLPKSTCDAIAAQLPVSYQSKYGLYFWNTTDPRYQSIISSASSLSFTFRTTLSTTNLTINVPFQLLNLTLEAPLIPTPTQYFPCKAETNTYYQLGRAFLQSAFLGANWDAYEGSAAWWLAQAPGPNIESQATAVTIGADDTTIAASSNKWTATWSGVWTPIAQVSGSATTTPAVEGSGSMSATGNLTQSGLSSEAKAGIGAGVSVGAIAILAIVGFFLLRGRRAAAALPETPVKDGTAVPTSYYDPKAKPNEATYVSTRYGPVSQTPGGPLPAEVSADQQPTVRYELD